MSIKKIAEKAGVSPATVSRVLNNPNYKCSVPGLRDKIWKTAIEMNYVPNEAARNLKKRRFRKAGENLVHQYPDDKNRFFHNGSVFCGAPSGDRKVRSMIKTAFFPKVWYMSVFSDDRKCRRENLDRLIAECMTRWKGKGTD